MKDCKGKEIRTGDIVLIAGAYFQNDNGHYAVIHSPGDKELLIPRPLKKLKG